MTHTYEKLLYQLSQHTRGYKNNLLNLVGFDFLQFQLDGNDLTHLDLSYTNLSGTKLINLNLSGVNFSYSMLNGISFLGSILKNVNFLESTLYGDFSKTDLTDVSFTNVKCEGALDFSDAFFSTQSFYGLVSELKKYNKTNCAYSLQYSILSDVDFSLGYKTYHFSLDDLDLSYCDVQGANFNNMDLTKINFKNSKVNGASFLNTIITPQQLLEFYIAGARDFSQVKLNGDIAEDIKKNSFIDAQLSMQAINYLFEHDVQLDILHLEYQQLHSSFKKIERSAATNKLERLPSIKVSRNVSKEFIETIHRQEEFSYLRSFLCDKEVSNNEFNIEVLALPFMAALNNKLIIYYLLQSVIQDCEKSFLASLDALFQIEERYQSQKPLSLCEKNDREIFSKLNPEQVMYENAILSEPIAPSHLASYLENLKGNFFLQVSFQQKPVSFAIYRKASFYSLIASNFIYIKNINNLNILMQILYHQNFDKFGILDISPQTINPNLIIPEITTEIARLKAQDKKKGLLFINGYPILRVFLYELGATIEENQPITQSDSSQLINSKMSLRQVDIDNLIHNGKLSLSADSIITFIERCIRVYESSNLIDILLINRISNKLHLTGKIDKVSRVMRIQEIIPKFNLTDLPKQLEPYLEFNVKRITRKVKNFRENVRNLEYVNTFISRNPQLVKFRLEFGKICMELDYSRASNDQFFLSISELVYIQHQNPIILKWKKILENKLGYLNYVASAATCRKITSTLNPYSDESIYPHPLKRTLKWTLQAPFDLVRIIRSSYELATNYKQNAKDVRDNVATIFFSSSAISEVIISDIFKKSSEFSIGIFILLTGSEMAYRGLSELEEDKNYGLTFNENLSAYLHAAFNLPKNPSLELLQQRIQQVQNLQKKAERFLSENSNSVYAVALGKLTVSYNRVKPKPTSLVAVEINRGRYFEQQNITMEVIPDYAFIQLDQESPIALSEFLSRLAPDKDNAKWSLICGPIYQGDKIFDPIEGRKKIATAIYYCNNAFVISNTADNDFRQTKFFYDLLLQDSGRVITSELAKENIFFIKEGIQDIIYKNNESNTKNIFYITGNFTGALVNKEDVSNQTNTLDCSLLKNKRLEFAKGFFYLNLRHSKYFKTQGITHFKGREKLADHIDCTASTIRFVASAGGTADDWDFIKNCQTAHLDAFSSLSSNTQANYVYYINKNGKFINLEQHNGTIDLYFNSLDLIHDTYFYYNFNEESLEVREKSSESNYIVRIKPYANLNAQKKVKLYNKDNFLLEPVTDMLNEASERDKGRYLLITNYIFKTITFLAENFMILEEYHNLISHTDGIALFGIVTQVQSREMDSALKIIGSNTINVVIPLGIKKLDYVYGGLGEDIYYLSLEDLESSLLLSESKTVHINNLAEDNFIDSLVLPVWTHELLVKRILYHLVIEFLDFSKYKLVVDDYFKYPTQQHLLLIDRIGREWVFKVSTKLNQISMVPYLRDFTMQLKYPFNAENEKNYFSIPVKFSECLYFKDALGLTLECTKSNNFPLQIPLFKFCQADKNNLKLFSSVNAALIYEEQVDAIDCQLIRAQRYLAFNRGAVETVNKKNYYGLDPLRPRIIGKDSTDGSVRRQLFIDDAAIYCQIKSWNETDLVFKFFNHGETLLGVIIVQEWNVPNNRISVIENNYLYISELEKWDILAVDELKLYVSREFLKAYLKKQAILNLKESNQLFENLEALLLILLMALTDQNTNIERFTTHEGDFDLKKVEKRLKSFLKNNAISKKSLVSSLVWVCLNTNLACKKFLPSIIHSLSLPKNDEQILKNIFIYLNFLLNNTRVAISGFSSLEKMIDAMSTTGWNTTLQQAINLPHEVYSEEIRPQFADHSIHNFEQEEPVVSKKSSNLASNKTENWSDWLRNRSLYLIGGAAATVSTGFFASCVGTSGFIGRFFGRRFGNRIKHNPAKIVNVAKGATLLEMTHRFSSVEGYSIDKEWPKILGEQEEVKTFNKKLSYRISPSSTELSDYPVEDFLLLANIGVRYFNRTS